jgi:hypothetical protein
MWYFLWEQLNVPVNQAGELGEARSDVCFLQWLCEIDDILLFHRHCRVIDLHSLVSF